MARSLTYCAILTSFVATMPAHAQVDRNEASPPSGAALPKPADFGDIIVTAQRRSEKLRDVPISVTALTPETLQSAGITNTRDLALVTPGLRVEAVGVYIQPSIRGITTTLTGVSADANVATYVDGVYQQTQLGSVFELPDVRQIEVLKGPQGTLFGRNATGGAILVNTLNPDVDVINGEVKGSYGSFGSYNASGYLSAPIIDGKMGASVTAFIDREGAFRRDLLRGGKRRGNVDSKVFRGKLRFLPWEGADFILSGTYNERDDSSSLRNSYIDGNNSVNRNPVLPPAIVASAPNTYATDLDTFSNSKLYSVNLRGEIEFGPGTLTSITAYQKFKNQILTDSDASPRPTSRTDISSYSRVTTQELVYAADDIGIVRPIFGAFFYWQDSGVAPQATTTLATRSVSAIYTHDEVDAQAVFGELNWQLSDSLKLITGLRYSHEKRTSFATRVPNPASTPVLPLLGRKNFDAVNPRVSAVYTFSPAVNAYATFSQGFKSGAFQTTSLQRIPVDPENVDAYEVGLKTKFGKLNVNLAGFHYDYTDLQVSSIQTLPDGSFLTVLQNAATARINGLELDGAWRPVDALQISFGGTWLDAKYKSFPAASVNIPQPDGRGGNVTVARDVGGNQMIRAPKFTGNLTASYSVDLGTGKIQASGSVYYSSRIYYDTINRISQAGYATANARLGWEPREGLEFSIYGRNLTNKVVLAAVTSLTSGDQAIYSEPRNVGVQARFSF